jgi:hypothetical protein
MLKYGGEFFPFKYLAVRLVSESNEFKCPQAVYKLSIIFSSAKTWTAWSPLSVKHLININLFCTMGASQRFLSHWTCPVSWLGKTVVNRGFYQVPGMRSSRDPLGPLAQLSRLKASWERHHRRF